MKQIILKTKHHFYYEKYLHKRHLFVIVIIKNAKNAKNDMSEPFDFEHHFYYEKHLHKKNLFVIVIVKTGKVSARSEIKMEKTGKVTPDHS